MSAHPADMERAEQLRDEAEYAFQNLEDAFRKVNEAMKDYELAKKHYAEKWQKVLDFKPVVEGQ